MHSVIYGSRAAIDQRPPTTSTHHTLTHPHIFLICGLGAGWRVEGGGREGGGRRREEEGRGGEGRGREGGDVLAEE